MGTLQIIELKKDILASNDEQSEILRARLKTEQTFLLNLMSSPGSGKTTTIIRTIEAMNSNYRIGVLEADIDGAIDSERVEKTGTKVVQLHTGGMCHLEACMTRQGIEGLGTKELDFVILENVGNLVCPAEFDTGASKNVMILSVPEGDDKPLKYPLMFAIVDVLLINKVDCLPMFDFDVDKMKKRALAINPELKIFEISAKTGQGFSLWVNWLSEEIEKWNSSSC